MKRGLLLLFVLLLCISADTDVTQERDMLIRKAIVADLYQIDISAGEWVDSFKVLSVDTLSEKNYLDMWTERIQLAMMFTERRLAMYKTDKRRKESSANDSLQKVRDEISTQLSIQKQQLDSCRKVMKHAEKKKGFGYLATTYRTFKGTNGIFLKGNGQYLITKDLVAEPYYKHNDTTRLLNDFILEARRYMRSETPE
jgi:hypothetical protein